MINYELYNFVYNVWEFCFEMSYVQMTNDFDFIDEIDWKKLIDWNFRDISKFVKFDV